MAWEMPSGPLQLPDRHLFATATTSLREPERKLRSTRASPVFNAFKMPEPDSSSEPAIRRAVPVRVTSEICVLPSWAASDCCKSACAEIGGGGGVWWGCGGGRKGGAEKTSI